MNDAVCIQVYFTIDICITVPIFAKVFCDSKRIEKRLRERNKYIILRLAAGYFLIWRGWDDEIKECFDCCERY